MRIFILLSLILTLAACEGLRERLQFGRSKDERALPFKAKLATGEDKRDYAVTVQAEGEVSVDDVRESVRFQATKYCLRTYGSSDADWQIDPATEDWAFVAGEGSLTFEGRCTGR